jgi:type IV pilus assembly protein PilV
MGGDLWMKKQDGFSMIEVLITIFLVAFGLIGMNSLQAFTVNNAFESYQRALMSSAVEDMAARVRMNPVKAKEGVYFVPPSGLACSLYVGFERDLCEWQQELKGTSVIDEDGTPVASPFGAVGCIESVTDDTIRVSVAWIGHTEQVEADTNCGIGQMNEQRRRVVYRDVTIS